MASITALLPTFNCAATVRNTLESVKWADRILVVDSFSTDDTVAICREYTPWIVQHEYVNSAAQKNWAMEQIETEWTLQIDSDEVVETSLRDEIQRAVIEYPDADGFRVRIKNLVWGKWVRNCKLYPCAQVRFFRSGKGRWSSREVHARLCGLAKIVNLSHHIIHSDLEDVSNELQQFSRQVVVWESNELWKNGRRWRWSDVTLRPLAIFLIYYFREGGYREGFRGFYLSVYKSMYSFFTYARLYELEIKRGVKQS
jgi:glycosyltransferase involved in cell wall biosynthesis